MLFLCEVNQCISLKRVCYDVATHILSVDLMMNRLFFAFAGFFGASGVILGSLASHALNTVLTTHQIEIFKLGIQYQMYHTLALLAVGIWLHFQKSCYLTIAGWLFIAGIILFSGAMYSITYLSLPINGAAPIGGFAFIIAWLLLIIAAIKRN